MNCTGLPHIHWQAGYSLSPPHPPLSPFHHGLIVASGQPGPRPPPPLMQPSASCNLWILHTHSDQSLVSVCPSYITDMFTVLLCLVGHRPGCEVASHCQLTVTRELAEQAEYSLSNKMEPRH